MLPEVRFDVPIKDVTDIYDEPLEYDEDGMVPVRAQKSGVYQLGNMTFKAEEVPLAGADYMSVQYFGYWEEVIEIAKTAEKAGLKPSVYHESYKNIWPELRT